MEGYSLKKICKPGGLPGREEGIRGGSVCTVNGVGTPFATISPCSKGVFTQSLTETHIH